MWLLTAEVSNLTLNRDRFSDQSPPLEFPVSVVLLKSSLSSSAWRFDDVLFSLSELSIAEARLKFFLWPACTVAREESNMEPATRRTPPSIQHQLED